jgi:hypothetical protein
VVVTWVAVTWVMLGAELVFALWAWQYSSAPLGAALAVTLGVIYLDLPAVPWHSLVFVAVFLVPVPFIGYVLSLRRGIIASDRDPLNRRASDSPECPGKIVKYFDQHLLAMRALHFRHAGDFVETTQRDGATIITFTRVFTGSDLRERAVFQGVLWRIEGRSRVSRPTLSFTSRLENEDVLVTTNARMLFAFQGVNRELATSVPRMRTPEKLLKVHRARVARTGQAAARQPTPHDWLEQQLILRREAYEGMADRKYCKRSSHGGYRMTWRGALRLAVADCPTLQPFLWFAIRRKESRLLRELGNPHRRAMMTDPSADLSRLIDRRTSAQSA